MIIKVTQELLDLIAKVEADAKEDYPNEPIKWQYSVDGKQATGYLSVDWGIEFLVGVWDNNVVQAMSREIDKYEVEYADWKWLKYDSDYEEEEDE